MIFSIGPCRVRYTQVPLLNFENSIMNNRSLVWFIALNYMYKEKKIKLKKKLTKDNECLPIQCNNMET